MLHFKLCLAVASLLGEIRTYHMVSDNEYCLHVFPWDQNMHTKWI